MTRTIKRFITQSKLLNIFTKRPETGLTKILKPATPMTVSTRKYMKTDLNSTDSTDYIINTGHVLVEMPNPGVK